MKSEDLLHDTSALRLSYAFNKVGGEHSLGKQLIRLSKYGQDSVQGKQGMQFIFHPIAYGPYMADKYGYPSVSKVHETDPLDTMKSFYGKQGILRVLTYTKQGNIPNGHVALWDCTHFHQTKDWITKHTLISVEFWESPGQSIHKQRLSSVLFKDKNTKTCIFTKYICKILKLSFYFSKVVFNVLIPSLFEKQL